MRPCLVRSGRPWGRGRTDQVQVWRVWRFAGPSCDRGHNGHIAPVREGFWHIRVTLGSQWLDVGRFKFAGRAAGGRRWPLASLPPSSYDMPVSQVAVCPAVPAWNFKHTLFGPGRCSNVNILTDAARSYLPLSYPEDWLITASVSPQPRAAVDCSYVHLG